MFLMYISFNIYIWKDIYMRNIYIYIYIYIKMCVCVCLRVCLCVSVSVYVCVRASWTSPPFMHLAAGVVALSAGDGYTCALVTGGGVDCWGYNEFGDLGTGDTTNRLTPTAVVGLGAGGSGGAIYESEVIYMYVSPSPSAIPQRGIFKHQAFHSGSLFAISSIVFLRIFLYNTPFSLVGHLYLPINRKKSFITIRICLACGPYLPGPPRMRPLRAHGAHVGPLPGLVAGRVLGLADLLPHFAGLPCASGLRWFWWWLQARPAHQYPPAHGPVIPLAARGLAAPPPGNVLRVVRDHLALAVSWPPAHCSDRMSLVDTPC